MIDKRLIDYSRDYKDYKKMLRQEGQCFSLEDIMALVEGFLRSKVVIDETLDNRDRAALVNLEEAYSQYSNL